MLWLFLAAAGFCVYTFAVFPLVLHMRAKHVRVQQPATPISLPTVSIVIAAHNEADNLSKKFRSLAELDYPRELLEVVVVSDGSTDNTVAVLERECTLRRGYRYFDYEHSAGKPTALNFAVGIATGEILVFMDARQRVGSDCVKYLVAALLQPGVGAVSGELHLEGANGDAANVGLYWRYEKWIRMNESRLFSTTGATGALYAIRRIDYVEHKADVLLDDFDTPVSLLKQHKRTLFVPEAQVFDSTQDSASGEFHRKARTLAGNLQSFSRNKWLFSPKHNPVWWQFLSHKVFRLMVPIAMSLCLLAAIFGEGLFLKVMLAGQIGFYGVGLLGIFNLIPIESKLLNFVKVFIVLNAATVVGGYRYLTGRTTVRWRRT